MSDTPQSPDQETNGTRSTANGGSQTHDGQQPQPDAPIKSPIDMTSGTKFTGPTPGTNQSAGADSGQDGGMHKTVANVLGEITWLMSQSPTHKNFFISDLEWLVMTPVLLKQFRLFYSADRPIGVALWGRVDEEVEARLSAGNAKLKPQDWKSGDKLWVVEIIAPFGGAEEMVKDMKAKVFSGESFKYLGQQDGKPTVMEL